MKVQYPKLPKNTPVTVTRSCPPDWTLYSRPSSDFCLKLFGSPNITYNQAQATGYCSQLNATLGGLESYDEQHDMTAQGLAINLLDSRNLTFSGFWVSGIRKSSCSTLAEVATPACNKTMAFDFTDKYLSTYSGYSWAPGNPDGVTSSGAIQNCIMLRTQTNGTTLLGMVDDVQCTYTTGTAFDIHGYVCGKIPGI
uniref:C-type lectin domain-containing protein n=1 Tax=Caenorhabditis tropicalis TaxID=1561998 RepID=A0A1I7TD55_9PELO